MSTALIVAVAVAVILVMAVAAVVVYRRRRRVPVEPARRLPRVLPRHPIVLVHGIMGFDEIRLLGSHTDYFRVADYLRKTGAEVYQAKMPLAAPIAVRAQALSEFVASTGARRVNLVAHSMGGLDARYAISRLGLDEKVSSLTTIAAPHHGSPLANMSDKRAVRLVQGLLGKLGIDTSGLADLTPAELERFNAEVANVARVDYASIVAAPSCGKRVNPLLKPTHLYMSKLVGINDGIVPSASQRWGDVIAEVDADHWAVIGWTLQFDVAALWEQLLAELRGRGV
jgi:triacylglycerol lipase